MERALTLVSDIGLIPIVGSTLGFNQVCVMFLIVYNKFKWILMPLNDTIMIIMELQVF